MEAGEAFKLTDELYQEMYDYWIKMEHKNIDTQVQKFLDIEWLREYGNWDNLNKEGQYDLLWGLGFNTKFVHPKTMKRLVKAGKKTELKEVVYGVERLDKEWIGMKDENYIHYASDDARDIVHRCRYGKYNT